jgi:hypothetical protein
MFQPHTAGVLLQSSVNRAPASETITFEDGRMKLKHVVLIINNKVKDLVTLMDNKEQILGIKLSCLDLFLLGSQIGEFFLLHPVFTKGTYSLQVVIPEKTSRY